MQASSLQTKASWKLALRYLCGRNRLCRETLDFVNSATLKSFNLPHDVAAVRVHGFGEDVEVKADGFGVFSPSNQPRYLQLPASRFATSTANGPTITE